MVIGSRGMPVDTGVRRQFAIFVRYRLRGRVLRFDDDDDDGKKKSSED